MAFSVVQRTLTPPTGDQLRAAFAEVADLTPQDVHQVRHRGPGIILDGVRHELADAAAASLERHGVPVAVVDETQLISPPMLKKLKRAAAQEEGLLLYDTLGRQRRVPWATVRLIAVGDLPAVDILRDSEIKAEADGKQFYAEVTQREKHVTRTTLALMVGDREEFHQLVADEFNYQDLGPRMTRDRRANFLLVAHDVLKRVPHALLNHGAADMATGTAVATPYPSRQAFLREIAWLLWWVSQPAA